MGAPLSHIVLVAGGTGHIGELDPCTVDRRAYPSSVGATCESAPWLDLVTTHQMIGALRHAVENPATGVRILEVPEVHRLGPTGGGPRV